MTLSFYLEVYVGCHLCGQRHPFGLEIRDFSQQLITACKPAEFSARMEIVQYFRSEGDTGEGGGRMVHRNILSLQLQALTNAGPMAESRQ